MAILDPITPVIIIVTIVILLTGIILSYFKMPSVIIYIIAGIILGKHGLELITDVNIISMFGSLGVTLLLFFIGMEISLDKLIKNWKVPVIGGILQSLFLFILIFIFGFYLNWSIGKIILISFVITLSSTAVVLKILEMKNELDTKVGQNVISILIFQDILVIPMIIIIGILGGQIPTIQSISLQLLGFILLILFMGYVIKKKELHIPFANSIRSNRDLQIFVALLICFGMAFLTNFFGLSAALGAFIAGMLVNYTKEIHWIHDSLHSFYILFVALFFVSIGLLIDIAFIIENWFIISVLVFLSILANLIVNFSILKILGLNIKESIYGASLLSQLGEFSFIIAALGFSAGTISTHGYNLVIAIISISLFLSPIIISFTKKIVCSDKILITPINKKS